MRRFFKRRRRFFKRRGGGRFRGRRRFHRRRRFAFKRIARKVRHLAKQVELKRAEFFVTPPVEVNNNIATGGLTQFLTPIPQGTAPFMRVGYKVFVKYIDIRVCVRAGTSNGNKQYFNVYVVRKKKCITTIATGELNPTTNQLWDITGLGRPTENWRLHAYRNDYHIMRQFKSFVDPTTVWLNERRFHFRVKVNKELEWLLANTDGELDALRKNAYWLIVRGDEIPTSAQCPDILTMNWVVRYTDM